MRSRFHSSRLSSQSEVTLPGFRGRTGIKSRRHGAEEDKEKEKKKEKKEQSETSRHTLTFLTLWVLVLLHVEQNVWTWVKEEDKEVWTEQRCRRRR